MNDKIRKAVLDAGRQHFERPDVYGLYTESGEFDVWLWTLSPNTRPGVMFKVYKHMTGPPYDVCLAQGVLSTAAFRITEDVSQWASE